ncbi:unnamed protein product [Leptosia nina]|uniref:Uncharacterized protein n=1 Tax=Leptosia nina TaxID=320188 RepID=A0AAV1JXL4_9NEOP
MGYKLCSVPQCPNTTKRTPRKLFVSVPKDIKVRRMWMKLSRRDHNDISRNSNIFFCEDHFDLENDMENYYQHKMGFSQKILLKENVLPSKFHCQTDRIKRMCNVGTPRSAFAKRQRLEEQCLHPNQSTPKTPKNLQSVITNDDPITIEVEACPESVLHAKTIEVSQKCDDNAATEPLVIIEKSVNCESINKAQTRSYAVQRKSGRRVKSTSLKPTVSSTCTSPFEINSCFCHEQPTTPGSNNNIERITSLEDKQSENDPLQYDSSSLAAESKAVEKKKLFKCNLCIRFYSDEKALERHISLHKNVTAGVQRQVTRDVPAKVVSKSGRKQPVGKACYLCPVCRKTFPSMFVAEKHLEVYHNKGKLYPPPLVECKSLQCTVNDTERHKCKDDDVSQAKSSIICAKCHKVFNSQHKFDTHVQVMHNQLLEYLFFPTSQEFMTWLTNTEINSRCKYASEAYNGKEYYYCSQGEHEQRCPALIIVESYNGGFLTYFYHSHYNHPYCDYKVGSSYKKYHITDLVKTAMPLPEIDPYLCFKNLMENLIVKAAKLQAAALNDLTGKALSMALAFNNYDDEVLNLPQVVTSAPVQIFLTDEQISQELHNDLAPKVVNSFSLVVNPETCGDDTETGDEINGDIDKQILKSNSDNLHKKKMTELNTDAAKDGKTYFLDTYKDFVHKNFVEPIRKFSACKTNLPRQPRVANYFRVPAKVVKYKPTTSLTNGSTRCNSTEMTNNYETRTPNLTAPLSQLTTDNKQIAQRNMPSANNKTSNVVDMTNLDVNIVPQCLPRNSVPGIFPEPPSNDSPSARETIKMENIQNNDIPQDMLLTGEIKTEREPIEELDQVQIEDSTENIKQKVIRKRLTVKTDEPPDKRIKVPIVLDGIVPKEEVIDESPTMPKSTASTLDVFKVSPKKIDIYKVIVQESDCNILVLKL